MKDHLATTLTILGGALAPIIQQIYLQFQLTLPSVNDLIIMIGSEFLAHWTIMLAGSIWGIITAITWRLIKKLSKWLKDKFLKKS